NHRHLATIPRHSPPPYLRSTVWSRNHLTTEYAMSRRVVITGMGVISPVGMGIEATFDALVERRSGIRRIEAFDPSHFDSQIGGEVPKYAMGDYVPKGYRKAVKVMARDSELAVAAAYL